MSTVQKELNAQTGQMAPMTDKVADTKEFPKTNDGEQSLVSFVGALAILASIFFILYMNDHSGRIATFCDAGF